MAIQDMDPGDLVKMLQQLEEEMDFRQEAAEQRDVFAKSVDVHSDNIKKILKELGVSRMEGVRFVANLSNSERSTISPEMLMAAGVPLDIINASKKVTTVTTLKVTARPGSGSTGTANA